MLMFVWGTLSEDISVSPGAETKSSDLWNSRYHFQSSADF